MSERFYGYKHWTLEDPPRCFNVGKGLINRPTSRRGRNHKWHAIVKCLGLRVEVCIGPVLEEQAIAWEVENIALMGTFSTNHSHDDPIDIGCNLTHGGEGVTGYRWTTQHREKVIASLKGQPKPARTRLHCQRLALANIGRKDTLEVRARKSESQKARYADPVERENHRTACNTPKAQANIKQAIQNRTLESRKESRERAAAKQRKCIGQFDLNGNLIATFRSATDAAKAVDGSQGNISRAARNEHRTASGFRWKYLL